MSYSHNSYVGRHFKLDKNFNFVKDGEEVPYEEITALELDSNNIFIAPPKRPHTTSQAIYSSFISTISYCTFTIY